MWDIRVPTLLEFIDTQDSEGIYENSLPLFGTNNSSFGFGLSGIILCSKAPAILCLVIPGTRTGTDGVVEPKDHIHEQGQRQL